jgi:hypothetical protein
MYHGRVTLPPPGTKPMNAITPQQIPARLSVVGALAHLLEKLERSPEPIVAEQYQAVVRPLSAELAEAESDAYLSALLDTYPAAAELYENLQYQHAGLCRSPLDAGLRAEVQAREAIARARAERR